MLIHYSCCILHQGQRFKTRKRDEKVKYDAGAFCDTVISNFNEKEGNLEEISRYLEKASSSLDYRLNHVLFAVLNITVRDRCLGIYVYEILLYFV